MKKKKKNKKKKNCKYKRITDEAMSRWNEKSKLLFSRRIDICRNSLLMLDINRFFQWDVMIPIFIQDMMPLINFQFLWMFYECYNNVINNNLIIYLWWIILLKSFIGNFWSLNKILIERFHQIISGRWS